MRQTLFSIAPDAPFLQTLAERVLDGTLLGDWDRSGPFWLSDVTIVLPTRRARLALAEQFSRMGHALLPDIRTFGGEVPDEEPFLPPFDLPALPEAIGPLERRLILAQLVEAWANTVDGQTTLAAPPNAAEILALADSLGEIIDDLETEGVSPAALSGLAPEHLAANWQQTLQFLSIALEAWPHILAERTRVDALALRNLRLTRQAQSAALLYADRPVIAAGTTGSIPATAQLLAAIRDLPRGVVVLPGLDTTLGSEAHTALLDATRSPHGHPQYGMAKLLRRLGSRPDSVTELAPDPRHPRTVLTRRALALADTTAQWVKDRKALDGTLPPALEGVEILRARTEDEEARAIALAARDALVRKKTVGIISPDRNLARRIAAELARFDIFVDDAAGAPLFQSAAGRFARHILCCAVGEFAPVDLMALLRNRATQLGLPRLEVSRLADAVELGLLRGQRPGRGLAGLRAAVALHTGEAKPAHAAKRLSPREVDAIGDLIDRLDAALSPLCTLVSRSGFRAADFAAELAAAFARVTATPEGEDEDRMPGTPEFERWAADTAALPGYGPSLPGYGLEQVLSALMRGHTVRNTQPRREDIAIWGELEARLQNPDLVIVAALNEDTWPAPADPGPWLSRGMRITCGLEPPELRHGQAAHDFEMALGNKAVILALSDRIGTSPATPSRYLQRVEAFIGTKLAEQLRQRGTRWVEAARLLDHAGEPKAARRPQPKPPAALRPRRLSITEIETLFRSPYDVYAKHVLKLKKLDPLGEEPGARERGSMIHDVFARFVTDGHDCNAPDALATLEAMARDAFSGLDAIGERRDIWLRRFRRAAEQFLLYERERHARVVKRHAELSGELHFPHLENFVLNGRADRLDLLRDGTLEVLDFKTGGVPKPGDMKAFDAPQLPLEAAIAREGGFAPIGPAHASALKYIKIGLGPEAFKPEDFRVRDGFDLAMTADEMVRRVENHVAKLLIADDLPMTAQVRPDPGRRYRGEYDHLARSDEWMVEEGDDSP